MSKCNVCESSKVSLYQIDNKKEMRYYYVEKCSICGNERKVNTCYPEFYG